MKKLKFGKTIATMLAMLLPVLVLSLGGCDSSGNNSRGTPVSGTVAFPAAAAKIAAKAVAVTAGPTLSITDLSGNAVATPTLTPVSGTTTQYTFSVNLPAGKDYVIKATWGGQVLKGLADATSLGASSVSLVIDSNSTAAVMVVEQKLNITAGSLGTSSVSSSMLTTLSGTIAGLKPATILNSVKTDTTYSALVNAVKGVLTSATPSDPTTVTSVISAAAATTDAQTTVTRPPDYANPANWRRRGDWTGIVAKPLNPPDVDVFFIYPTTFFPAPADPNHTGPTDPENKPSSWNQTMAQAQADPGIEAQVYSKAGVFYKAGTNLYAPFYRQAAGSYVLPALLWKQNDANIAAAADALAVAYSDVSRAFDYYIANYNKDSNGKKRPFILAGHSQGSNLLLMLLKQKFSEDPALRDQLVAAYVIGWSVTSDDIAKYPALKQLGICNSRTQTKCIVTYNTQQDKGDFSQASPSPKSSTSPGSPPSGIVQKNAYSVNPLTWVANGPPDVDMGITSDTEPTPAMAADNMGALFFKLNSVRPDQYTVFDLRPQLGLVDQWKGPGVIANWNVWYYDIDKYTGAQNIQGALVIDPSTLPAPGNYKNLNPPYNTNDANNNPNDPNDPKNQPPGWYHNYDYSFFWYNLEQNAIDRIKAY